jgi:hypothetical protein
VPVESSSSPTKLVLPRNPQPSTVLGTVPPQALSATADRFACRNSRGNTPLTRARNHVAMRRPTMELAGLEPATSWVRSHHVNVAILQGYLGNDRQTSVPKIIRSLREFTRVLARRGVGVAKPPDGTEAGRSGGVGRSPACFVASETDASAPLRNPALEETHAGLPELVPSGRWHGRRQRARYRASGLSTSVPLGK